MAIDDAASSLEIRVGVDVGGTNTDAAVVDVAGSTVRVLGTSKRTTTTDVVTGAVDAVRDALGQSKVAADEVSALICGTTHFINALVTRKNLAKVGVLRLCLPATQALPPFADVPASLAAALGGHFRLLPGGVEYNGVEINPLDEAATRRAAVELVDQGATSLVICQVYAPMRRDHEHAAAEWVRDELLKRGFQVLPGARPELACDAHAAVDITLSADVAGIGLLERENASILNAALRPLARQVAGALSVLSSQVGLQCPVLLTQNDGSVADVAVATALPIRAVQSGPVNSAVGAFHLSGVRDCILVDVGGTTTDVGQLVNGVPRPSSRDTYIAGVRTNYEMPDVLSVALGGGTIIAENGNVGPASVGQALTSKAKMFGGDTMTATCVASALGKVSIECTCPHAAAGSDLVAVWDRIQRLVSDAVDAQRSSAAQTVVVAVGGGAFLYDGGLGDFSMVVPPHASCANAVGAACARASGSVDIVENVTLETRTDVLARAKALAVDRAVARGADAADCEVVAVEEIPLAYMPGGASRIKVKAMGRLRFTTAAYKTHVAGVPMVPPDAELLLPVVAKAEEEEDAVGARGVPLLPGVPSVLNGTWDINEADVDALALGVGILGCGGGGSPYDGAVRLKVLLASGRRIRVVHVDDAPDGLVSIGGYMGAPTVLAETLASSELAVAALELAQDTAAFMAVEIGGRNGLEALVLAAQTGRVAIDGDIMGRAFPELQMQTAFIEGVPIVPCALVDKHSNTVVIQRALNQKKIEAFLRPVCGEMGCAAGLMLRPLLPDECRSIAIPNTLSHAWRLGRAVLEARHHHREPVEAILAQYPGGRALFSGKIVDVHRQTTAGFARGMVKLHGAGDVRLDFQNEFLVATQGANDVLGCVPDLLCLVESATGRPIATEEVRYGLRVTLLCLPAPPQLRTEAALLVVGPGAFGYADVRYCPVGDYIVPTPIARLCGQSVPATE